MFHVTRAMLCVCGADLSVVRVSERISVCYACYRKWKRESNAKSKTKVRNFRREAADAVVPQQQLPRTVAEAVRVGVLAPPPPPAPRALVDRNRNPTGSSEAVV